MTAGESGEFAPNFLTLLFYVLLHLVCNTKYALKM